MFDKLKKIFKNVKNSENDSCCDFNIEEIDENQNSNNSAEKDSCCDLEIAAKSEDEIKNEVDFDRKKQKVKNKYGRIIKEKAGTGCCSIDENKKEIPSFGVGDPLNYANIKSGEYVIDIGSGPGKNCLKAAKIVGDKVKVIGLDMTEEMINSASEQAQNQGLNNVEFVNGDAEDIPFAENYFDVAISDCVINLIPDKEKVFTEIYRVLKKDGRMVISDVVSDKKFPSELKEDDELWCGCVSGAIPEKDYLNLIKKAGFEEIEIVEKNESKQELEGINIFHITVRGIK